MLYVQDLVLEGPQAQGKHIWNEHMPPKPLEFSFSCVVRTLIAMCEAALGCSLVGTEAAHSVPLDFPVSVTVTMTVEVDKFSSPRLQWLMWEAGGGPVFTSGEQQFLVVRQLPVSGPSSPFSARLGAVVCFSVSRQHGQLPWASLMAFAPLQP